MSILVKTYDEKCKEMSSHPFDDEVKAEEFAFNVLGMDSRKGTVARTEILVQNSDGTWSKNGEFEF